VENELGEGGSIELVALSYDLEHWSFRLTRDSRRSNPGILIKVLEAKKGGQSSQGFVLGLSHYLGAPAEALGHPNIGTLRRQIRKVTLC
jgi:hypothetical protein